LERDRVATGFAARPFKEVTEMWKKVLDGLLAAGIAADPIVYMYWLTAQREAEEQREEAAAVSRSRAAAAVIRPIELARRSPEATA
jgi:hypothetical protein